MCVDHVRSSSKLVRSSTSTLCNNCGRQHAPRSCPAYGKTCRACNKMNHFEEVCRSSRPSSHQNFSLPRSQYKGRRFSSAVDELCSNDKHQQGSLPDMNELTLSLDAFTVNNFDTWYQQLSLWFLRGSVTGWCNHIERMA